MKKRIPGIMALLSLAPLAFTTGCSPTVKLEAPDKPIVINMNIKIDHEIRVKLDKDIEQMLDSRKDIF
ncbi:MAG: YnbE family lipoprotein [Chlorobiaceae bacterium]|nr:YnbE family lipoprotein [Chlorobiaceae bacterium]